MKKFTFLFILLFSIVFANAQDLRAVQKKIDATQEKFFRHSELLPEAVLIRKSRPLNSLKSVAATMKLDSVVTKDQSPGTEVWVNSDKEEYFYDSQLTNTSWQYSDWNLETGSWEIDSKSVLEVNNAGKISTILNYVTTVENPVLHLADKMVRFYGESGMLDSVQMWITEDEVNWTYNGLQVFHYNDAGKIAEIIFWMYEQEDEELLTTSIRYVFTYNGAGLLETTEMYFPIEDEEGEVTEVLWNIDEYFYDGSGRQTHSENSTISFMTMELTLSSRSDYEYDDSGDLLTQIFSTWDEAGQAWVPEDITDYTYNTFNFSEVALPGLYTLAPEMGENPVFPGKAIAETQESLLVEGTPQPYANSVFYYSEATSTLSEKVEKIDFSVYPNPASTHITVRWNDNKPVLMLEVYQVTGSKIAEKQVSSGASVSLGNIDKGLYLFKIKDGYQTVHSGKLLIK